MVFEINRYSRYKSLLAAVRHAKRKENILRKIDIIYKWCEVVGVSYKSKGDGTNCLILRKLPRAWASWSFTKGSIVTCYDWFNPKSIRRYKVNTWVEGLAKLDEWIADIPLK